MQLLRITIRDNNIIKNSESSSKGKARGGGIFPKRKHVILSPSFPHSLYRLRLLATSLAKKLVGSTCSKSVYRRCGRILKECNQWIKPPILKAIHFVIWIKKVTDRWWSDWSHRKDGDPAKQPSAQSSKITQLHTQNTLVLYTNS